MSTKAELEARVRELEDEKVRDMKTFTGRKPMTKREERIAALSFAIAYIDGMTKASDMQDDEDVKKTLEVLKDLRLKVTGKPKCLKFFGCNAGSHSDACPASA